MNDLTAFIIFIVFIICTIIAFPTGLYLAKLICYIKRKSQKNNLKRIFNFKETD